MKFLFLFLDDRAISPGHVPAKNMAFKVYGLFIYIYIYIYIATVIHIDGI